MGDFTERQPTESEVLTSEKREAKGRVKWMCGYATGDDQKGKDMVGCFRGKEKQIVGLIVRQKEKKDLEHWVVSESKIMSLGEFRDT